MLRSHGRAVSMPAGEHKAQEDMMAREEQAMFLDDFISTCRSNGLKITPQRIAIYKSLLSAVDHPSADMVYRKIRKEYPTISFDTVNRTLLKFAEIGVIHTVESHSGVRRFDPDIAPHHHMHCVQCGEIIDFCDRDLDDIPVPDAVSRQFTVLGKRVVISGLCDKCIHESVSQESSE